MTKLDDTEQTAFSVAAKLLREALPTHGKLLALSLFSMVGVAAFTAALAYSTRLIVNDVFVANDSEAAVQVALFLVGITLSKSVFDYMNSIVTEVFMRSVSSSYQKKIFRNIILKDVRHFVGRHASRQMAQVRLFGQACGTVVIGICCKLLTNLLTVIALVIVMFLQDPVMTLATVVLLPLVILLVSTLSKRVRQIANAETELTGAFFSIGAEAFEGIRTVKSYQLEEKSINRFDEAVNKLQDRLLSIARITAATLPIMEILGGIILGLFVIYAAWKTIVQGQTPGEFTAFITAFLMAYQPAERVSKTWVELQKSVMHVGRMYELLDEPLVQPIIKKRSLQSVEPSIRFDQVSFHYTANTPALTDISFGVSVGESIAIVGRSGAGKSTLIDLVLGFYNPTAGKVFIGDQNLRKVCEESLRETIALISQDVFLFDGTISDNIRDGNPNATDADIADAVRMAQLENVLNALPNGIDSVVGPNGTNLSGGQKQRVGIARALAKKAKIYIFDEATSALDVENERLIMETITRDLQGATLLFVTHRPSTFQYVDRVLMLEAGRLVGFDHFETLKRENHQFQTLFDPKTAS